MDTVHLPQLSDELLATAHTANSRRAARTLYADSHHRLRQTVIALVNGAELTEHKGPEEAHLQVLRGRVELRCGNDSVAGDAGDVIAIPTARHSLEALADSVIILTLITEGR